MSEASRSRFLAFTLKLEYPLVFLHTYHYMITMAPDLVDSRALGSTAVFCYAGARLTVLTLTLSNPEEFDNLKPTKKKKVYYFKT